MLSPAQRDRFHHDGFLVLEGFAPRSSCEELRGRAGQLLAAFDPRSHHSVFTTSEQTRHSDD